MAFRWLSRSHSFWSAFRRRPTPPSTAVEQGPNQTKGALSPAAEQILAGTWIKPPNRQPHERTIIFLHALGDEETQWPAHFNTMCNIQGLKMFEHTRVVLPRAAKRRVLENVEEEVEAWFTVLGVPISITIVGTLPEDHKGIAESTEAIHELLDRESELVPPEKILLCGMNEGASMSAHAGLRYRKRLGGIIALNGHVICPSEYPWPEMRTDTPVHAFNSRKDILVDFSYATTTWQMLHYYGVPLTLTVGNYSDGTVSRSLMRWFINTAAQLVPSTRYDEPDPNASAAADASEEPVAEETEADDNPWDYVPDPDPYVHEQQVGGDPAAAMATRAAGGAQGEAPVAQNDTAAFDEAVGGLDTEEMEKQQRQRQQATQQAKK